MKAFTKGGKELEFRYHEEKWIWRGLELEPGWYRETTKNIYKVFFDEMIPKIWIGKAIINESSWAWGTCERELRITRIELLGQTVNIHYRGD